MKLLMLGYYGVLAAGIAFVTNWLALMPWRRVRGQHWTEQARLYFPVKAAAATNFWAIPGTLTTASLLFWREDSPPWFLIFFVSAIGTIAGTFPMDREVWPRISSRELIRQAMATWVLRFSIWLVFLGAVALMPEQFNWTVLILCSAVVALCLFWNQSGWLRCGRMLGIFAPAPDRLQKIVDETSARMNVPVRHTWLMRSPVAQAYALPQNRSLLFSERLLEILSDEELAAVCAHELGHLNESPKEFYQRYIMYWLYLPWLIFKPLVHWIGMPGFFLLLANTMAVPFLYRSIAHRLEKRADEIAKSNELNEGAYARALLRLHEDSLLPAVVARQHGTHPHLYDRLIAAGLTPDFPRPAAAAGTAWNGSLFSILVGGLAAILVIELTKR